MQWDGKTWSILHTPHKPPQALDSKLVSISCGSASSCFGVGTYQLSHHPGQTLTERWDGTRWALVSSPNPPKPFDDYDELTGVACASATSCLATGAQYDNLYGGS